MPHARLTGTGLYAPARVVPNAYFDALYGEDVSTALRTRRRIEARRYAADDEATSDLALHAAEAALADAGRTPDDVDLLLLTTDTPDYLSPATAAVVQHKLGATRATAFDLNAACAGFVVALDTARTFVEAGRHGTVLVVSAYLMSRFLDYDARTIAPLFADGAGAAVVEPTDGPHHVLAARTLTEGGYHGHMGVYAGGTAEPLAASAGEADAPGDDAASGATDDAADGARAQTLEFRRRFPRDYNPRHWTRLVRALTSDVGVAPDDVDHYFFTQVNIESIHATLDALDLPHDRAHNVMDRYGYTGNACIPMALAEAAAHGRLAPGDLVLLVASGGGATIAGIALRWGG
jgi:3-oxoacyl-[acyl-carrier-protein] synthase-3